MPNNSIVFKALILVFAVTLILTTPYQRGNAARRANQAPGDPGQGAAGPYHLVHGWPVLSEGFMFGHVTGVGVDSHNHVFVFHRADHSTIGATFTEPIASPVILCFDGRTGALVTSWGANTFLIPHGLRVDQHDNIWVTDIELQQVLKFNHNGQLLMAVGEAGVAGLGGKHFNEPTDVAVAPDGSFYVSDGEGNSRVAKFSANGEFLFDWGQKGDQPGEFNTPHGIAMDGEGRIYVADRGNSRIQVFRGDGTFLYLWESPNSDAPGRSPSAPMGDSTLWMEAT